MKWTDDQKNSIYAAPTELVVSAAAGSGKTQVLTTRIIERLKNQESPVSVDKLLIVTFTKAAAAEMKERIGKSLRNAAKTEENPETKNFLKRQLTLLGSAKICTIDSFCYDVVKQNYFRANLPADISLGEPGEISLLKLSAIENTIDALYAALDKYHGKKLNDESEEYALIVEKYFPDEAKRNFILDGFHALTITCGHENRDCEFVEDSPYGGDYTTMIMKVYEKAQASAYPDKWLINASNDYNESLSEYENTLFYNYAYSSCIKTVKDAAKTAEGLMEYSLSYDIGYERMIANDLIQIKALCEASSFDELRDTYKNSTVFGSVSGLKRNRDKFISCGIKEIRKRYIDAIKETLSPLLEFSAEECNSLRTQIYPQINALCNCAILFGKIFYEKMLSRKIIDFSTCAHLALSIISENGCDLTETGISLQNKYDEIYIDEIQDSNDLQDMLFSLLSNGRDFMVGDVKQSIYGFRNADPSIFMNKCNASSFDENAKKRKIYLSRNFRSRESIINGVNSIFDVVMTEDTSGIDYKAEHRLEFGRSFIPDPNPNEKCEVIVVEKQGNADICRENEIKATALQIKKLIEEEYEIWDKDKECRRPVDFKDITILSHSFKHTSDMYERIFAEYGIPCYVDGNNDFYETNEIEQIIEILKLIDNSKSDISLASALRSPMFMFDENELLKIKLCSSGSFCDSFYGICRGKYEVEAKLKGKCIHFMKYLSSWKNAANFATVEEIIRRIYIDTNIYSNILSFPDGQMRRANLDLLLEKAEEFERSSYSGLFNFVNYIQKIKRTGNSTSEAKAVNEKMNVVRIMTIHKSKGLEFPIVFVTECGRTYLKAKTFKGGLMLNSHAGIAMSIINPLLRSSYKSPMQHVLEDMTIKDNCAEEMRLFYVALTRAREKLYMVATVKNEADFSSMQLSDFSPLTLNEIRYCQSYISLFATAYSRGADSYWKITYFTPEAKECQSEKNVKDNEEFIEDKKVSEMLNFKYPHITSVALPNKASVSALKTLDLNMAPSDDGNIPLLISNSSKKISLKKPVFGKKADSATFFGNAHHKLLQYIEYNGESAEVQCRKLLEKGILTEDEFSVIDFNKIEEFISSSLGKMLEKASKIYREEPFVIEINAKEISSDLSENDTICVQGIIDCFFEYGDKIILVDYKTDKYNNPSEIAEKYKMQLYYYSLALKKVYKDKIIQKYLYLLHKNDIIEL